MAYRQEPAMGLGSPSHVSERRLRASECESGVSEQGGMPDLSQLLEQAQAMQQQLMEAQAQAAEQVVEGVSGGGVVKVTVTGGMDFQSVTIDPAAVDPEDVEMLQDLVL